MQVSFKSRPSCTLLKVSVASSWQFNLVLHQDVVLVWMFRALVGMIIATETASMHNWHNEKCNILLTLRGLKVWIQQTLAHVRHRRFLVILWEGGPPCCLQYSIHWCALGNSCWGSGRPRTVCTEARGVCTSSVQNIPNPSGNCTLWNGSIRLLITNKQLCFCTPKIFCSANIFSNGCNHTQSLIVTICQQLHRSQMLPTLGLF